MADDGLIQPNAAVEEYTARAREAHGHLGKHWNYWMDIGRPIYTFKLQLDQEIRVNEGRAEDTQRWRDSMGAYLRREGWHESQPTGFTKSDRVNLMHCMSRLDEIEAYRMRFGETKGQQKLLRHNSPSQVWRSFLKDIGELETKEGGGNGRMGSGAVVTDRVTLPSGVRVVNPKDIVILSITTR